MINSLVVTRFAPSPTGELHLGNVRTALFNALLARREPGGRFLLRIEDTDRERSRTEYVEQLQADLRWLGLQWDDVPVVQSQRTADYDALLFKLEQRGHAYGCFCSPRELELSRAAQLAAGRPPRYSGKCRGLSQSGRAARVAAGERPTLRFVVPEQGTVAFTDLVHGAKVFPCDDIGDFVLRRADGTAAFFFSNAVDDATSGVTHVFRGDDHLSNTPRQMLILQALGMSAPQYGHLALLTGSDGAPLSKRNGAASLRAMRDDGLLPLALLNHLFRLGHSTSVQGLLSLEQMATAFDTAHLQRSPAHFEMSQLMVWQKDAVHGLDANAAEQWLGTRLPAAMQNSQREAFISAVLPNLVRPDDVLPWVALLADADLLLDAEAEVAVQSADRKLFAAAAAAATDNDFSRISQAAREATGLKGPALFKPLRAALTGRLSGPELAPLLRALPPGLAAQRLARFA